MLQDAGFPLHDEKAADGYRGLRRLSPEFLANLPLKLTLAEVAALGMSRDLLAPLGWIAFEDIAAVLPGGAPGLAQEPCQWSLTITEREPTPALKVPFLGSSPIAGVTVPVTVPADNPIEQHDRRHAIATGSLVHR